MKKVLCMLLAVLLLASLCTSAVFAEAGAGTAAQTEHSVEMREFTLYLLNPSNTMDVPLPLYFADGVDDLPYMEVDDFASMLVALCGELSDDPDYAVELEDQNSIVVLTRESGYTVTLDFEKDLITFMDYAAFLHNSEDSTLLDLLWIAGYDGDGNPLLFQRDKEMSFDRYGDIKTIDLNAYGIDIFSVGEDHFIPLQTVNDIFFYPSAGIGLLFNGEAVFLANDQQLFNYRTGEWTPLAELYYDIPAGQRSDELAEYSYNELCLGLDLLYGLKETHDISSFRQLFWEIGFDEALSGNDPVDADQALRQFIDFYLDDLHSSFNDFSPLAGPQAIVGVSGSATRKINENVSLYTSTRAEVYGDNVPGYEEVGNTAYITFDEFTLGLDNARDYYDRYRVGDIPEDTLGLIIYAHEQITREDSPIENVVLDMSCNTGGTADAAVYVLSWFLGEAQISVKDMASGAMSTAVYRADINLDGVFDKKDTVADRKLYCLISPVSFSCGNLVPAALKSSQKVTLLGRTSGGGSCVVQPLSTAYGTLFQISGWRRLSFLKNGSFYDIDQGVDPDFYIDKIVNYYNREDLTDYINGLF